jgi:hypothetical protein
MKKFPYIKYCSICISILFLVVNYTNVSGDIINTNKDISSQKQYLLYINNEKIEENYQIKENNFNNNYEFI